MPVRDREKDREMLARVKEFDGDIDIDSGIDINFESGQLGEFRSGAQGLCCGIAASGATRTATRAATRIATSVASSSSVCSRVASRVVSSLDLSSSMDSRVYSSVSARRARMLSQSSGKSIESRQPGLREDARADGPH